MGKGSKILKKAYDEMQKENPNLAIAFELLNQAAGMGNVEATYAIGTWYLHGKTIS